MIGASPTKYSNNNITNNNDTTHKNNINDKNDNNDTTSTKNNNSNNNFNYNDNENNNGKKSSQRVLVCHKKIILPMSWCRGAASRPVFGHLWRNLAISLKAHPDEAHPAEKCNVMMKESKVRKIKDYQRWSKKEK